MARVLPAVGIVVVALACKRPPADPLVAAQVADDLLRWAPPPRELRYDRKRVVGTVGLPMQPVRVTWTEVDVGKDGIGYDVVTGVESERAPQVVQRLRYGADGLSILAEGSFVDGEPELEPWVPPLLLLPPHPKVGAAWEATHEHGGESVPRSCEILISDQCSDGMVVVCDRTSAAHRLLTRDHFCADGGWAGYESMLVREGTAAVRTWTEGLRRVD